MRVMSDMPIDGERTRRVSNSYSKHLDAELYRLIIRSLNLPGVSCNRISSPIKASE